MADHDEVDQIESSIVAAIAKAEPSVVAIGRRLKSDNEQSRLIPVGIGVCIERGGRILTHYDVLAEIGKYDYFVWLPRDKTQDLSKYRPVKAQVLAADPWTNLACIVVENVNLPPVELGTQYGLKKGQLVITVGGTNSIATNGTPSAGWGIVSNFNMPAPMPYEPDPDAESRPTQHHYGTLIQVDARINFDTHGGALLDRQGKLIGLLTTHAASPQLAHPAGFAIPVNDVFIHAVQSLTKGKRPEWGLFGVQPRDLSRDKIQSGIRGIQVVEVIPNTPAEIAGLRFGDLIQNINGINPRTSVQLTRMLSGLPAGTDVTVDIRRSNENGEWLEKTIKVQMAKKFVSFTRAGYPRFDYPSWNGIRFDDPTAVENLQEKSSQIDPTGCIAVVDVEQNSAAWDAGLRAGVFVSHINDVRVQSVEDLLRANLDKEGPIRLRLTDPQKTEVALPGRKK